MCYTIEITLQEEKLLCIASFLVLIMLKVYLLEDTTEGFSSTGYGICWPGGTSFVSLGLFEKSFNQRSLCMKKKGLLEKLLFIPAQLQAWGWKWKHMILSKRLRG